MTVTSWQNVLHVYDPAFPTWLSMQQEAAVLLAQRPNEMSELSGRGGVLFHPIVDLRRHLLNLVNQGLLENLWTELHYDESV
jgi:hypothetical protein